MLAASYFISTSWHRKYSFHEDCNDSSKFVKSYYTANEDWLKVQSHGINGICSGSGHVLINSVL